MCAFISRLLSLTFYALRLIGRIFERTYLIMHHEHITHCWLLRSGGDSSPLPSLYSNSAAFFLFFVCLFHGDVSTISIRHSDGNKAANGGGLVPGDVH